MKKKSENIAILFIVLILSLIMACLCIYFVKNDDNGSHQTETSAVRGVWWWNGKIDQTKTDDYLEFAQQNNVNAIYYSSIEFGSVTESFITKANARNINVYWLDGDYRWLTKESYRAKMFERIENYKNYNLTYPNAKFSGIHFDVEPHQSPDFKTSTENRISLITKLIELASLLKTQYKDIHFTFDIPFWLHDSIIFNNQTKPAYAHLIDILDNVVIMSYRDKAEKIYSVSSDELEYAESINKKITLSVECSYSDEGSTVTFYEEGKKVLNEQLNKVYTMLPEKTGMAIHSMKSWYELKD